jgi:hypothetical protein
MADDELSQLRTEMLALQQRLADLERIADAATTALPTLTAVPTGMEAPAATAIDDDTDTPIGRRQLLRRLGYAAAGAAAVGALAGGDRAAAADGGNFILGQTNISSSASTLSGGSLTIANPLVSGYPLVVENSNLAHIKLIGSVNVATAPPSAGVIALGGNNIWVGNNTEWRTFGGVGCAGALYLLDAPARVYDSRSDTGPLTVGFDRTVALGSAVPAGASGAIINLTATGYNGVGLFAVFSASATYPGNSTLNYSVGSATATSATTAVSATRSIKIRCLGVTADAIVDVVGYYK